MATPLKEIPQAIDDGGSAFPKISIEHLTSRDRPAKVYYPGMSLRQWYAGRAMQGMLSSTTAEAHEAMQEFEAISNLACKMADLLIAALKE